MVSDKPGLNEDEYIALVERIQRAMCLEPFQPDVTDVVVLIGTCRTLDREIERLRIELHRVSERALHLPTKQEQEIEQLRARLAESEAENDQWQKKLADVWAEIERLRTEQTEYPFNVAVSARAEVNELRTKLALERDKWRAEIDREARERQRLRALIDKHNDKCRECPVIE